MYNVHFQLWPQLQFTSTSPYTHVHWYHAWFVLCTNSIVGYKHTLHVPLVLLWNVSIICLCWDVRSMLCVVVGQCLLLIFLWYMYIYKEISIRPEDYTPWGVLVKTASKSWVNHKFPEDLLKHHSSQALVVLISGGLRWSRTVNKKP